MANFFLIDHSLQQPGGHHSDYATCIAQAAKEMGFQTTIGTHSSLGATEFLDGFGDVRRVFRKTTYQRDSYLAGLRHLTRAKQDFLDGNCDCPLAERLRMFWKRFRHRARREKFIRGFAQDCHRFFQSALFDDGDHAFFSTVSELELMGLAAYLSNQPRTLQVNWHLQFHYNLFDGRPPEYDQQQSVARAIQSCFDAALSRVPYHAIHFYTTSETLSDQYNRLEVGEFEVLPYPVSPSFCGHSSRTTALQQLADRTGEDGATYPLRLTCPGGTRREKGQLDYLQPLVNKIWEPHLERGNIKIVVQSSRKRWTRKRKLDIELPRQPSTPDARDPIEFLAHPLSTEDYIEFIKSSDCGLLFYDSRVYFSRRAGVLGELLSCGKPVIVPAGSWLSEQVQAPIFDHVADLSKDTVRVLSLGELNHDSRNVPLPGGIVSFDQNRHPFGTQVRRHADEGGLIVHFDWHWPSVAGVFARVEICEYDGEQNLVRRSCQVVGPRRTTNESKVYFAFHDRTEMVELKLRNAFHDSNASVKNLQINLIARTANPVARGAVGIIAADQDDLSGCIDELVKHYDHYRDTAVEFAQTWARNHQPRRTIAHLISTEQTERRAA